MANAARASIGGALVSASALCARRIVLPIGLETPLLVPSFSSRGYPEVGAIFACLCEALGRVTLVSAYDLHFGALTPAATLATEVVVIDSGGYEARPAGDLNEPYVDDRQGRAWSRDEYLHVLDELPTAGRFLIVSFDAPGPIDHQIAAARYDLDGRGHASNFLCKPRDPNERWLDVDAIVAAAPALAPFSVLGVTEKELGPSPLERCRALVRLRTGLARAGMNLPIHVFGCGTPLSTAAYFLCGADIFDGLAWLRYAFGELPCYGAEFAIVVEDVATPDDERWLQQCVSNLAAMGRLQHGLRRYAEGGDQSALATVPVLAAHLPRVLELVRLAGGLAPEVDHVEQRR